MLADTTTIENPLTSSNIEEVVDRVVNFLILVFIPIAVIMILYSALMFITAGGDEARVKKAKQILTWAIVGIAILLVAKSTAVVIKDFLGVE
ncbi:MAG: hypothetical protein UT37_C0007G0004 [Parcubacteria group bacterium GW2011_GWA2_39_18]|nr:MAG: hypothetical protein UT37_C0007G0004 [Parcubacteria group bacterium GW2011_GWA2_39_18]